MLKFAFLLTLSFYLAGCGSLMERGTLNHRPPTMYYSATWGDLRLAGLPFACYCETGGCNVPCNPLFTVPAMLIGLISLPIDAVIDTLLLPHDYLYVSEPKENEE